MLQRGEMQFCQWHVVFYVRFLSFRGRLIKGWVGMLKKNCEVQKSLEGEGGKKYLVGGGGLKKNWKDQKSFIEGGNKNLI